MLTTTTLALALCCVLAAATTTTTTTTTTIPSEYRDVNFPLKSKTLRDGTVLSYVDLPGHEHTTPIVCLHGYTDSWNTWRLVMPLIQEQTKSRVISISLPCFGDSSKNTYYNSYPRQAAAVIELLQKLRISSAIFMGHSMSSVLVQQIAVSYPTYVKAGILTGPVVTWLSSTDVIVPFAPEVYSFTTDYDLTDDDPMPRDYCDAWQRSTTTSATPEWFLQKCIDETMKVPIKCWKAGMDALMGSNLTDVINEIEAPILTIRGVNDFAPESQVNVMLENIKEFVFAVARDSGHAPHWEHSGNFANIASAYVRHWPVWDTDE